MESLLRNGYGFLFEEELLKEITKNAIYKDFKVNDVIIDIGDKVSYMPLLLEGAIKILREDDQGDELLLYFLEIGDTCAMTLNCCMGNSKSDIKAVAEQDVKLALVPVQRMDEWIVNYKSWRSFVLDSYNLRLKEMLEAIDSLAFLNMHDRLHKYLIDKVKVTGSTTITNTHQEIATELHSSRVVISRLLKQIEKEGKIELHRNKIEVLDF